MRLLNSIYDEASGIKKVKSSKFTDKFYSHDFSKGLKIAQCRAKFTPRVINATKMNKKSRHKEVVCCLFTDI